MLQRSFFALGALLLALASPSLAPASDTVSRMCHRNDDFTILEKANEGVGTTFTIRKTTPSFKADCTFEERPTDTVIGQNGNDDAFYYIALRCQAGLGSQRTAAAAKRPRHGFKVRGAAYLETSRRREVLPSHAALASA